jgi:predicted DNA-binding transcriptional regulator YafY
MPRNDRLFALAALLRGQRVRTAAELAQALGVSVRTLYRDVEALRRMGVPVDGEAGVGYRLAAEGDLPAVAFTGDELAALALGARMVATWSDPELAAAARSAVARIEAALPAGLRSTLLGAPLYASEHVAPSPPPRLGTVRAAVFSGRFLDIDYVDGAGQASSRLVRPLTLHFWGSVWTLGAWCELRSAFRAFRVDRIRHATTGPPFPDEPGRGRADLFDHVRDAQPADAHPRAGLEAVGSSSNTGVEADVPSRPPR